MNNLFSCVLARTLTIIILFIGNKAFTQDVVKKFFKLPYPEKFWVLKHPFIAKNVYQLSIKAINVTISLKSDTTLDRDMAGGQLDAFRHAYWMAIVTQRYGKRRAISLGRAHEKGNFIQFKKGLLEDELLPDYESSQMDFLNNDVGIEIGNLYKNASKEEIKEIIIQHIKSGKLYVLKKDSLGNFLNCQNEKILFNEKKWQTGKCIIPSNIRK